MLSLIAGLPYETRETLADSKKWLVENEFLFSFNILYMAGPFFRNPEKYGYRIKEDKTWVNDYWSEKEVHQYIREIGALYFIGNFYDVFEFEHLTNLPLSEVIKVRFTDFKKYKQLHKQFLESKKKIIQDYKNKKLLI